MNTTVYSYVDANTRGTVDPRGAKGILKDSSIL